MGKAMSPCVSPPCVLQVEAYQHAREHSERLFSSLLEEVKTLRSDMVRGWYTPTVGLQYKPISSVVSHAIAVHWFGATRWSPCQAFFVWKVGVAACVIVCIG